MISIFSPEGLKEVAKEYRRFTTNPFSIEPDTPQAPVWRCDGSYCTYWRDPNTNSFGGKCAGACALG